MILLEMNHISDVIVSRHACLVYGRSWVQAPVFAAKNETLLVYSRSWVQAPVFSAKHETLRSKSKDFLSQNQNKVSEWSDMSFLE
jgi:hypothetical protein